MVEQNFRFAAPLADRFYVMEHGADRRGTSLQSELEAKMPVLQRTAGGMTWSAMELVPSYYIKGEDNEVENENNSLWP